MPDGKHCPACQKDIGVWAVFSASLPHRVRCPHCRARVRYTPVAGLIAVAVVLAFVIGGAVWAAVMWLTDWGFAARAIAFGAFLVAAWVPVELAIVRYLRANARLVQSDSGGGGDDSRGDRGKRKA